MFSWKKWAVFTFLATNILEIVINIHFYLDPKIAILGLLDVLFLFSLLFLTRKDISGWKNMI